MAKHAVSPDIPISDSERLMQAEQILRACIGAIGTNHRFEIDLSYPLEVVHGLVQDVIEHREAARLKRPGEPRTWITGQLQQAAAILKLCIVANDTSPDFDKGFDFSPPMHSVVALLDEAWTRLGIENDERSRKRPSKKKLRELEFLQGATTVHPPAEGKPN